MSSVRTAGTRPAISRPPGRRASLGSAASGLPLPMLLALALTLASGDPEPAHFRIVNCFPEQARAEEALEAAEAAVPVVLERLGVERWSPSGPRTLQLHADFARFRAATAAMNPDAPEAHGYTNRDSRTAHVTVQPAAEALRALGLSSQTRRLIAHEVTHLVCFDLLPEMTTLPGWMVEGLADSVAHEVLCALGRSRALEEEPCTAAQILAVQELIRANQAPRFGTLLHDRLAGFDYRQRYALRWLFHEFLRERRAAECARLFRVAFAPNASGRALERVRPLLAELWTPAELAALDAEFLGWVGALRPHWSLSAGVCEFDDQELIVLAPTNADALAVNQAAFQSLPFHVQGELRYLPGSSQQLHLVLGHREDSFLLVSFTAGWGVTLWRHEVSDGRWLRKAAAEVPLLGTERACRFRVEADATQLGIHLDGQKVLCVPLDGAQLLGRFGLGAQAGSNGEWSALEWAEGG